MTYEIISQSTYKNFIKERGEAFACSVADGGGILLFIMVVFIHDLLDKHFCKS
jgi:hypothetical protein